MPTSKKSPKSSSPKNIWLAPLLVAAGIVGLCWALNAAKITPTTTSSNNGSDLQVQSGGSGSTNQSQTGAGTQLQGAARTKDLINGRDANNLQQGSGVETLTKDADL